MEFLYTTKSQPISPEAYETLTQIIEFLDDVTQELAFIDSQKIFDHLMKVALPASLSELQGTIQEVETKYQEIQEQERIQMQNLRFERLKNLLNMAPTPSFTVPTENQIFGFKPFIDKLVNHVANLLPDENTDIRHYIADDKWHPILLQSILKMANHSKIPDDFGVRARSWNNLMGNADAWVAQCNEVGKISVPCHTLGDFLEKKWRPDGTSYSQEDLNSSITDDQDKSEREYKNRHFARMQKQQQEIKEWQTKIAWEAKAGPRIFECPGKQPLYSNNDTAFANRILSQVLEAEHEGHGDIRLMYTVRENSKTKITITLSGAFHTRNSNELPIELFPTESYSFTIAPGVYPNLEEFIYNIWYGENIYTGEKIDLSCSLWQHTNPLYKAEKTKGLDKVIPSINPNMASLTSKFSIMIHDNDYLQNTKLQKILEDTLNLDNVKRDLALVHLYIFLLAPQTKFPNPDLCAKLKESKKALKKKIATLKIYAQRFTLLGANPFWTDLHQSFIDLHANAVVAAPIAVENPIANLKKENADLKAQLTRVETALAAILAKLP